MSHYSLPGSDEHALPHRANVNSLQSPFLGWPLSNPTLETSNHEYTWEACQASSCKSDIQYKHHFLKAKKRDVRYV